MASAPSLPNSSDSPTPAVLTQMSLIACMVIDEIREIFYYEPVTKQNAEKNNAPNDP
jgi:hypothetical protein